MIATIVKTVQLKSLGAKADYTCEFYRGTFLNSSKTIQQTLLHG